MKKIYVEDIDYKLIDKSGEVLLKKYGMMKELSDKEELELVFIQEDYSSSVYRVAKQDDSYYYCEFIRSIC